MRRIAGVAILSLGLVSIAAGARAADPTPIRTGQTVQGELSQGDRTEPDGSYFDVFAFEGRAGESVAIEMQSKDLDSVSGALR